MGHCEPGCTCCATGEASAPLAVTINPEARVSVARTSVPLPRFVVGEWTPVPLSIVNEGFVTGPLAIHATPAPGVEFDLTEARLTGRDQESSFRVRFAGPAVVDVDLSFRALGALGGLADHSTVPLLLRCEAGPELAHAGHHGHHRDGGHGHH